MLNVVCKAYYKVEGELRGYLPPEFLSLSFPGLECNSIPGPLKKAWYSLCVNSKLLVSVDYYCYNANRK